MSRIEQSLKNIFFGITSSVVSVTLGFVSRTIFIHILGITYLGVNGLLTNVLGILSLAELGIGTAMNFSLYKPAATHDIEKIKALMRFYKLAYRVIALVVAIIGLLLLPFLKYIIKNDYELQDISLYYIFFLFNTVISYFVTYKYSLANAEQKNYIVININTISSIVTITVQIISLLLYKNFLVYLIVASFIGLVQKIFINVYLNRLYPYLLDKDYKKLTRDELLPIKTNVIALIWHKIGDISVHQTGSIIISYFINIVMVGIITNYNLVITSVGIFINVLFNSVISGFGNLIVTENKEKQYKLFKVYRFLGFWIYGFAAIAFFMLLTPFIELWIGPKMIIEDSVTTLIVLNYYFMGHRIVINNFKTAAGIYDADKYIAIIQAIVNLVISIVLVQYLGLIGVYIGALCSGLVSTFMRPYIVYKAVFSKSVYDYYLDSILFLSVIVITVIIIEIISIKILIYTPLANFIILIILISILPNIIFYLFFRKREEYKYLSALVTIRFFKGVKNER